jgi:hypothetical protein
MRIADLVNFKDEYSMRLAQGRHIDSNRARKISKFLLFKGEETMSLAGKAKARAAALRAGKSAPTTTKKTSKLALVKKSNSKAAAKKTSNKTSTPRAESKTATILEMLKKGSSREVIRKKYGMDKLSDVGWYISKFKNKGLLPKSFSRE